MEQKSQPESSTDDLKIIEIRRICAKNGNILTDDSCGQLVRFVRLLRDWNSKVNLISRKDTDNIWESHILHSLGVVFEYEFPKRSTVLDLGSGGGLPGVPLKIVRPDLAVTMLDATRKKVDAVRSMVAEIGLKNVTVEWGRAEDKETVATLANSFDVVVARAVAPLHELAKWARPLVRPLANADNTAPHLIALKGGNLEEELARVRRLSFVKEVTPKDLTFNGGELIPGTEKKIVFVTFDI